MVSHSDPGPAPRALLWAAIAVLVASATMMFAGAREIGVTTDEPYHAQRFENYLQTGWYVVDGQRYGDVPGPKVKDQFVYGPSTMLYLHGLGVLTGTESPGEVETSSAAYLVRHLGVVLLSVLGLAAVGGVGRLIFRRWDWGVVAAAFLAATPIWTGHSLFNLKDVPVGTGYALVTLGLCLVVTQVDRATPRRRVAAVASVALGTYLAVGTRPGMWAAVAASVGILVLALVLKSQRGTWRAWLSENRWRVGDVAIGLVVAYAALLASYPKVFSSPEAAFVKSAFSSTNFLSVESKLTFVPSRVFLETPPGILAFIAIGAAVGFAAMWRARGRLDVRGLCIALVLVHTFTLPVIAIVTRAALYGDLRQLLFAAPGAALLATLGAIKVVEGARRATTDRGGLIVVTATVCAALVVPVGSQATLFPYGYTYFGALTDVAKVNARIEYYRASARALLPSVPVNGRLVCSPDYDDSERATRIQHLDGYVDCGTAETSPIAAFSGERRGPALPLEPDEFWAITFIPDGDVPKNCVRIKTTSRSGFLRRTLYTATLSRCRLPFPVLGANAEPISVEEMPNPYLDLGWYVPGLDGEKQGARTMAGPSSLRFTLASQFGGGSVDLVLRTDVRQPASNVPRATFAGEVVQVTSPGDGDPRLVARIPASLVDLAVRTSESLVLTSGSSGPLDIRVLSISATLVEAP